MQSWWAKVRHKEDPNSKIGSKTFEKNETFMALDGIDLTVYKGERLGIIGHNGAGKSTLLKLLSRVTGPTEGEIKLDGRISSMLEVGTGFNPELTGRENAYLNGAILGMTKAEIDSKIEKIIDFSEVRQFIDTPVKRYSSGMYVKLAFAVASHLDSEILIMDEVLAVGDMAFQQKCLNKMNQVSQDEGRTILYVSHNMNTIRQLCDRVVVLDHGQVIFDGDVEEGINIYMGEKINASIHNDFTVREYDPYITGDIMIVFLDLLCDNKIQFGEKLKFKLSYQYKKQVDKLTFRFTILQLDRTAVATTTSEILMFDDKENQKQTEFELDISMIAPGDYQMQIVAFEPDNLGNQIRHDYIPQAVLFTIYNREQLDNFVWSTKAWGATVMPKAKIIG